MDDYDTVSTIGRGGSGKVFLVRSKDDQRQYAMKQIILNSKSNTKESVLKEAKILATLKHPHVVSCYKFFFDDLEENLYILQDYCDGGTLRDQILMKKDKHENINEDKIMQWFVQILMAVQHIHSNKILHRDLKTENVFITKRNIVKIGDFGIAKIMENTLDMAQTCCGTPYYLSPELCHNVPYTSKADIWALGCLLYELCCLQPAFSASNLVSLFHKIVTGEVGQPLPSMYSDSIANLISQMMSKSPDDRPSAGLMLSMQYVNKHLSLFIEGKEALKDQRRPGKTANAKLSEEEAYSKRLSKSPVPICEISSTPDYPDDFEALSSDDEREYSDDFDEGDESLTEATKAKPSDGGVKKICVKVDSYSDEEFESDSESLQDVLISAKAAQDLEVDEEIVEDDERPASICRGLIKEECINVLGEKAFNEFCEQNTEQNHPGEEFEKLGGSEKMEACFLVNKLFTDDSS